MRYLKAKWLTTHEKSEKKTFREPFGRVLAHDGVEHDERVPCGMPIQADHHEIITNTL
jgi:hypothetical protein